MYRIYRLFITIVWFLLLIDNTTQSKIRQTSMAFQAIDNTIKNPLIKTIGKSIKYPIIKTIGNTIKKSVSIFRQKKNTIKNLACGIKIQAKQYARTRHNFGIRSVKYLGGVINKYKVPQRAREGPLNIQMKSAPQMGGKWFRSLGKRSGVQMGGKELGSLVNMVSKSKRQVPFLFAGGLMKLTEFNVMAGNNFDDAQIDMSNSSNETQELSLPYFKSEIMRLRDVKPTSVVVFDVVKKLKCKSSIENFNFTVILADGLRAKQIETKCPTNTKISPFVAPFDEGTFITKINETHILLFNRYQTVKNHLQVVPEKFLKQDFMQTDKDFTASYRALFANQFESPQKSVCFYNSGINSGASQLHRHLQIFDLDKDNFCTDMYKVIDAEVKKNMGEKSGYTTFSGFKGYKHLIYKFSKLDSDDKYDLNLLDKFVKNEVWEKGYVDIMKKFEVFDGSNYNRVGKFDYNVAMSDTWIMVALRANKYAFGSFDMNACGLLGGLLVTSEHSQLEWTKHDTRDFLDDYFIKEK